MVITKIKIRDWSIFFFKIDFIRYAQKSSIWPRYMLCCEHV